MISQNLRKAILLLTVVGAISCVDEPTLRDEDDNLVQVRNGMLEFPDRQAYDQVNQRLEKMSKDELNKWESSLTGFVSIRSIYYQALSEEETFFENGGSLSGHCAFVNEHIGALKFLSEDALDMLPNLPPHTERRLSSLVNEEGLVKIGNSIFEYRGLSIKEIRDGDEAKIKLLNNYVTSDMSQNIFVTKFTRITPDPSRADLKVKFVNNDDCTGYTSGGGQRVKGSVYLFASESNVDGVVHYYGWITIRATNQEKKLGVWLGKRTSALAIVGYINASPSEWGSYSANLDTGGDLDTTIEQTFNLPSILKQTTSFPSISGSLTFYGRQGTTCSI
jgi:hypothetical protein